MNIEAPRITIAEFDAICAAEGGMVEHYGFVTEQSPSISVTARRACVCRSTTPISGQGERYRDRR
jgi:hypothetical protein